MISAFISLQSLVVEIPYLDRAALGTLEAAESPLEVLQVDRRSLQVVEILVVVLLVVLPFQNQAVLHQGSQLVEILQTHSAVLVLQCLQQALPILLAGLSRLVC